MTATCRPSAILTNMSSSSAGASTGSAPGAARTATAVVLAVAVLAVTGAVFGYLLGARANPAGGQGNGAGNGPTSAAGDQSTSPAAPKCPDFIQTAARGRQARGDLRLRLYIQTEKSEVWICAEDRGPLWYQGHSIRNDTYPREVPVE